jgi:hypothetical protein
MSNYKRISFFYGMISADIFSFRNVKRDADTFSLVSKLRELTGRDDGGFMALYAQRLSYTDNLEFNWGEETEDIPADILAFEEFWKMYKQGEDAAVCYDYYINNIRNHIGNEWQDAVNEAHKIWKPTHQNTNDEEGEETDPN